MTNAYSLSTFITLGYFEPPVPPLVFSMTQNAAKRCDNEKHVRLSPSHTLQVFHLVKKEIWLFNTKKTGMQGVNPFEGSSANKGQASRQRLVGGCTDVSAADMYRTIFAQFTNISISAVAGKRRWFIN
ncbi:hypothetical protein DPX16_9783 [Anabarilius grahami]|uniref:Uncharacterized protein n=1 Tax=Anabarilius grahami TaxID=495550 RepID=A0A3N0Y3R7_ANAGA|nr:hypothetical protein DPX16_9783 [Anabarilius grahami]